jgi:hypothetical protein
MRLTVASSCCIALCLSALCLSGCAVTDAAKSASGGGSETEDADESSSKKKDDWVKHNMRSGRPLDSENDPTKKWLYSDKHLEIERSLGIGE